MREEIRKAVKQAAEELIEVAGLKENDIFVLGMSSSEIQGGTIGAKSTADIGEAVVDTLLETLRPKGIYLAVQACEHINRALVVERELAERKELEIVDVIPVLHAGGAGAMAAYKFAEDPVLVEHITAQAGLDIGDTSVGMHVKHVQVPVRLEVKEIGSAHVTALRSRLKKIGGERAEYHQ